MSRTVLALALAVAAVLLAVAAALAPAQTIEAWYARGLYPSLSRTLRPADLGAAFPGGRRRKSWRPRAVHLWPSAGVGATSRARQAPARGAHGARPDHDLVLSGVGAQLRTPPCQPALGSACGRTHGGALVGSRDRPRQGCHRPCRRRARCRRGGHRPGAKSGAAHSRDQRRAGDAPGPDSTAAGRIVAGKWVQRRGVTLYPRSPRRRRASRGRTRRG